MSEVLERRVDASMVTRDLVTRPDTWNAEQRTIEVCWTTGARGARFDWNRWDYIDEELATEPENVRLDRLNGGAAVLNTHQRYDLDNQIGVVVPGSARMEGGMGIATLQLSSRETIAPIVGDIGAGIIRNLSVGYQVHVYEITEREGQRALYRAVDWEPSEISFVPVPFDAGSQTRSSTAPQGGHPCIIRRASPAHLENTDMSTANTQPAGETSADETRNDQTTGNAVAETTTPPAQLMSRFTASAALAFVDMARAFGDSVTTRANELVEQNERGEVSVERARSTLLDAAAEAQRAATGNRGGPSVSINDRNEQGSRAAIVDMLVARCLGTAVPDASRPFMGMRLLEIAAQRAGLPASERDPINVLRAANTSSDFPLLLETAGNRVLLERYNSAPQTFTRIARRRNLTDFKPTHLLRIGDFPTLQPYAEDGEIKAGTINEGRETVQLASYGRILRLSRQAIVNDDLNAFDDVFGSIGTMIATFENANFYVMKQQNAGNGPKLADGANLFSAGHGNLAAAGAAPDVATLGTGRAAMRKQKNLDGNFLNLAPRTMLVGVDIETEAEKLTSPLVPQQVGNVNPFSGRLDVVAEPSLPGNSWELYADPAVLAAFVYGSLAEAPGPRVISEEAFNVDGMSWRVTYDFYAGAVDHRPAYRNPGA